MNLDTGELKTTDDLRELFGSDEEISAAGFVPVPKGLSPCAMALIGFRDEQRKLRSRRRNRTAKRSRRRNRGR